MNPQEKQFVEHVKKDCIPQLQKIGSGEVADDMQQLLDIIERLDQKLHES